MKEILKKYWEKKKSLGLQPSDYHPEFANYDIPEKL